MLLLPGQKGYFTDLSQIHIQRGTVLRPRRGPAADTGARAQPRRPFLGGRRCPQSDGVRPNSLRTSRHPDRATRRARAPSRPGPIARRLRPHGLRPGLLRSAGRVRSILPGCRRKNKGDRTRRRARREGVDILEPRIAPGPRDSRAVRPRLRAPHQVRRTGARPMPSTDTERVGARPAAARLHGQRPVIQTHRHPPGASTDRHWGRVRL